MKKFLFIVVAVFAGMLLSATTNGQPGWQWGLCSTHPVYPGGIDVQQTAIDRKGNVFAAGYGWGASMSFGTITISNPTAARPLVIVKADSSGNFLWAIHTLHSSCDATGMVTDTMGNLYIVGIFDSATCTLGTITLSNPGSAFAVFLAKISPAGSVQWANVIGDGSYVNSCLGIDAAQHLYMTGTFSQPSLTIGTTTLTNHGTWGSDVYVAKFDTAGNAIWATSFGGTYSDEPLALSVAKNGTVSVSGQFSSSVMIIGTNTLTNSIAPNISSFIASFDINGNPNWAKEIPHVNAQQMVSDAIGNTYLTGYIDTNTRMGADTFTTYGNYDIITAKFTTSGAVAWAHSAGGTTMDIGYGIAIDDCGNLFICGEMGSQGSTGYSIQFGTHVLHQGTTGLEPMFIAEYDTSGNYQNSLSLISGGDDFSRIVVDNNGNFYIGGDYIFSMVFGHSVLPGPPGEALMIAKFRYDSFGCLQFNHYPPSIVSSINPQKQEITIYPNPTNYKLTIESDAIFPEGSKAEIYDITGRLISSYSLTGKSTVIAVAGYASGMYQCRIISGNGNVVVKKLVIMK